MKCDVIRRDLPDFARGALTDDQKSAVEQHLATCAACRKDAADLHELFLTLQRDDSWMPSSAYFAGILPRLHDRIGRKSRGVIPAWVGRWVMPLASVAFLAVVMLKVLPLAFENKTSSSSAILEQMPTDDLSEYIERQSVVGVMEPTGASAVASSGFDLGEDRGVLKSILKTERADYTMFASENETLDDVMTDRDENDIMPILEKQYSQSGE